MLLVKRLLGLSAVIFLSMTLAGCLVTPVKLLGDYGDRLQIGPEITCVSADNTTTMNFKVAEERSENLPSKFRYNGTHDGAVTTVVAKEIGRNGQYLLQMSTNNEYQYLWYREDSEEVLYFDSQWPFQQEDAVKHNVEATFNLGTFDLQGTPKGMLSFLREITDDVDFLPVQFQCYWTTH